MTGRPLADVLLLYVRSAMTGRPLADVLFMILACPVSDDWAPPDGCFVYYSSITGER